MCTSFVVHSKQTFIGMNFDISDRPIKMLFDGQKVIILQQEQDQFYPALGMNHQGTFMNLLEVNPVEAGKYRRGKNCVHMMRLFDLVLGEEVPLTMLEGFLESKSIVNVPNYSVHSMIAGLNHQAFVVEPGRMNLSLSTKDQEFMVLTNFPLSDYMNVPYTQVQGYGSDRYKTAYDRISRQKEDFDFEKGLSILQETAQFEGDYPTQLSFIFIPEDGKIFFTLQKDFQKVFRYSFVDQLIQTQTGFIHENSTTLTKRGMLLSELQAW